MREKINNEYFKWLFDLVCGKRYSKQVSYKKLLTYLHDTEFIYIIERDRNRAEDGIDLRYRFAYECFDDPNVKTYLTGPCSVLEMMVALAIRCEDNMDDPRVGDRTGQWFWGMIVNLGLGSMTDNHFDKHRVRDVLQRFLEREYEPDGRGGLFTIKNCKYDLRDIEIWYQLSWYLGSIT